MGKAKRRVQRSKAPRFSPSLRGLAGTSQWEIIISPFTKHGGIDNTEYETVSILKLIEQRFHLAPLSPRDKDPKITDLTHALGLGGQGNDSK
jgi:hypothetical protein